MFKKLHKPSQIARTNLTAGLACLAGCHCGVPSLPVHRVPLALRSHDANVAFIEVYTARGCLEALRILDRLTISIEVSFSAFEFIAQSRSLLGVPLRVVRF
jgi:hypothetical protein